jgi:hypothetical protein
MLQKITFFSDGTLCGLVNTNYSSGLKRNAADYIETLANIPCVFRPGCCRQNSQWIWSASLTEIRTVVWCMGYKPTKVAVRHPPSFPSKMQLKPMSSNF